MRTIKLRVFHNGKVFGYEELRADGWYSMCPDLNPDKGERWDRIVMTGDGFIRVQWTGLTDKNGKDIYEGDICRRKLNKDKRYDYGFEYSDLWRIEWISATAGFTTTCIGDCEGDKFIPKKNISQNSYSQRFSEMDEVIGNIYEHPNLLK